MPMEIELTDTTTITHQQEADAVEVAAADLINGRGEERITLGSKEHFEAIGRGEEDQSASKCATVSDDGEIHVVEIDSTINQENGEHTSTVNRSFARWVDTDEGKAAIARFEAEDKHKEELFHAKQDHTAAALARAAAEDAYKAAKSHEKACLATLSALIARGPDYPKPALVNQGGGDNESAIDQAVRNDKSSPSLPLDDPNADQTWRAIPLAPMLDGIKGMGDKKREAILSLTPTLGDFEDLRGKASQQHKLLKDVMPKGIGAAMADELEEKALSVMSKHQAKIAQAKIEREQEQQQEPEHDVEPDVEYEDA